MKKKVIYKVFLDMIEIGYFLEYLLKLRYIKYLRFIVIYLIVYLCLFIRGLMYIILFVRINNKKLLSIF